MNANTVRQKYLDFFKQKGHKAVASDSLVPKNDPTLLFTTAGMNQFKMQFLGMVTDYRRATSSQRCLRTDDLDKVGKTDCHHTFFEMLGNFSFGDYFKREAILWAWEFLTRELKLDRERLWVSVYKDDTEAFDIWKDEVKFPESRIVRLGDKDNFWPSEAKEKGPNGPCGPCSEIFVDLGPQTGCKKPGCSPACSCGRFIEIWNLVFTQFNRKEGGVLEPLPQKNIDTGMGLERITAVMQGKTNNFETDLFQPVIKEILAKAKVSPKQEVVYALADHLRAVAFTILDGVMPSNEFRGYVIRKLIRKSVLHLYSLGIKEPFLYALVPVLAEVMSVPYPELKERRENVSQVIQAEERNFIAILEESGALLEEKFAAVKARPDAKQAGQIAFLLNDTYGIPFDLTQEWALQQGIEIDKSAFDEGRLEQSVRSRQHSKMQGDVFDVKEAQLRNVAASIFVGYESMKAPAEGEALPQVIALVNQEGDLVNELGNASQGQVILDRTPFYAESGGQAGDAGTITFEGGSFVVEDTHKVEKVFLHKGQVKGGALKVGVKVTAEVNAGRRLDIMRNHTATHLLQAALRKVLGEHVQQQGSMVAADRFRFDFAHFKALTDEELAHVEAFVNEQVIVNHAVTKKVMDQDEAKAAGALAFFGDKYEDKVRVVAVPGVSQELCGGTHLDSTGQIGLFKIISESSVASGVRRIEGVTGKAAYELIRQQQGILNEVAETLRVPREKLASEVQKKLARIKELEKQLSSAKSGSVISVIDEAVRQAEEIAGIKVVARMLEAADMAQIRSAMDAAKQKLGSGAVALAGVSEGKVALGIGFTPDLVAKGFDAGAAVREVAPLIGGSGGGRKDFAQAGGSDESGINKAFEKFKNWLRK